jgi:very-short-patch-repair endonuclease
MDDYDKALADYEAALRFDPSLAIAYSNWRSMSGARQEHSKAIADATVACELTGWRNASCLATLAAAYNEAGNRDAASRYQEKAVGLYEDKKERQEGRALLVFYQSKGQSTEYLVLDPLKGLLTLIVFLIVLVAAIFIILGGVLFPDHWSGGVQKSLDKQATGVSDPDHDPILEPSSPKGSVPKPVTTAPSPAKAAANDAEKVNNVTVLENMMQPRDPERERAIAIFRYLRELALLRTAIIRDLKSYDRVFWLDVVRGKPGCTARCFRPEPGTDSLGAESSDEDVDLWLTVRKLPEPVAPPVPALIEPWMDPGTGCDPDSPPRLFDRILRKPTGDTAASVELVLTTNSRGRASGTSDGIQYDPSDQYYDLLEDHEEVTAAFTDYMETGWKPWAAKYKAWLDFQENVYSAHFGIHRDLKRLGEEFELVLGLGVLTWRTPSEQPLRRHLIGAQVTLEFDPAAGEFTLRPGSDGAKLAIEVDMIDPARQPTVSQMDVIRSDLAKAEDDPWAFDPIDCALRGIARAIDEDGRYYTDSYSPKQVERVPQVAFAPALLLRRRTSRGLLVAFQAVIEQLEKGADIPPGVRRLTRGATSDPPDGTWEGSGAIVDTIAARHLYLPLPANEDQQQIVRQLTGRHGVLVQGPPGTGKSHTIANLICHLLATGQRLLITAQTPRALQVLRDKLPARIRPLCLSLLGNDRVAQDNFEDSVRRIMDEHDTWNADAAMNGILKTEQELDALLDRETALVHEAATFREAETHKHTIADGAYGGTAQEIACRVRRDQQRFAWFSDSVDADAQPAISADDLRAYRDGRLRLFPGRAAEVELRRPARGVEIPSDEKPLELVRGYHDLRERVRPEDDTEIPLRSLPLDELKMACTALRTLQTAVQQLPAAATPWAAVSIRDVLRGASATWELLFSQTSAAVSALDDVPAKLEKADIRLPAGGRSDLLLADVTDLLAHLQRGGRLGFWIFRPMVVRRTLYVCREATVDGRPCETATTLATAKEHLECSAAIARAWTLWEGKSAPTTKTNCQQVGELRELTGILGRVLAVRPLADVASAALVQLHLPSVPPLDDLRAVDDYAARIERVIVRREFDVLNSQIDAWGHALRTVADAPSAHPLCARLADAVEQRNEHGLSAALGELAALEADAMRLVEWTMLDDRISAALPRLARAIRDTAADATWKERFPEWTAAWRWARADAWLRKYTDSRKAAAVDLELQQVKDRIRSCLEKASAERAWHSCLSSMSRGHEQHLAALQQAIKKLGAGKGKFAAHWRRVAQSELEQCRGAIPAWVMPLYRVFENVTPAPGIFDVVIVDEASQCGPESLILFFLAKKMIIVGDDKQISPSNVGLDKEQAKLLLQQHLDGIELTQTFDVDSSLFDHGHVRFGKRITLLEHFRCMPEIIRFSNDLCYKSALIPLRQYPPNRLAPFVARYTSHGKKEGSSQSARNEAEAEAIVDTISACCADPMYNERTMGVISLLGEHQAKLIERSLLKRIGAEEIERRRIVCGDAYSFQGDERHVIFLSMVVAANAGFRPLTSLPDMQRFNVAVSRAQDQMWLFHSVMPENIGNPACMRHRLLTYFYDPGRPQNNGVDLAKLRRVAESPDRPEMVPEPFDSWFEVDVYLRIVAHGYRVLPQYPAGRHRIDLVVEGKTRLAIECDGDRWHGPDKLDEDMARQRQLERANWRFWRLRGSAFYRDHDAALQSLWPLLGEMGIEPMPPTDGSGSSEGYVPTVPPRESAYIHPVGIPGET